jgi:hypothetical protein
VFPAKAEPPPEEVMDGNGGAFEPRPCVHCVLLDRRSRNAYISDRGQAMILFALGEPENGDEHTIFMDHMLMSPGTENYKVPPPVEFTNQFRRFFDAWLETGH